MRRILLASLVVAAAVSLHAQEPLAALQGRWVVTGGEHNGKPMDSLKGGVLTVARDTFEIRTASGNMLRGTLKVDGSAQPRAMDMVHADGVRWEAVFAVEGDTLKLNYVEAGGKDPRPKGFTTSPSTEESLILLRRQDK
jgi:uncharacterized protein (TIGR03067 family)